MRSSGGLHRCLGWVVIFAGVALLWLLIWLAIGAGIEASCG